MWLPLFTVFAVVFLDAYASGTPQSCKLPGSDKSDGKCIRITDCSVVDNLIKSGKQDKQTLEYIKRVQCGYDGVPFVCCGTSDQITTTTFNYFAFGDLFSTPPTTTIAPGRELEYFNDRDIPDRTICGPVKPNQQIAYGEKISIGEFPWLAALLFRSKVNGTYIGVLCGGSLINSKYVLTAAHCLEHNSIEVFRVLLGEWDLTNNPDCYEGGTDCAPSVQNLTIARKILHPFYSKLYMNNDIGLLRLGRDAVFSEQVRPICLPPPNLPLLEKNNEMTVAGWGITELGSQSDIALKAFVKLLDTKRCRELLNNRTIYTKEFCASNEEGGDACSGDSGGPLMRTYKDGTALNWFLEGLVGSGLDCRMGVSASVYIRVSKFTNWILREMSKRS